MTLENLDSVSKLLISQEGDGYFARYYRSLATGATTAATVDSGHLTASRYPDTFVVPSVGTASVGPSAGASLTGYMLDMMMAAEDASLMILMAIEVSLGTYNHATNTFTDGSAMPTRDVRVDGTTYSQQTAAPIVCIVPTTIHAATAWIGTITYVDENGTGSKVTSNITVPASAAINSAFMFHSKMATDTLAIQDITAMGETSGPATGVDSIYGLIPLAWGFNSSASIGGSIPNLIESVANVIAEPGDTIAFYRFNQTATSEISGPIIGRPA